MRLHDAGGLHACTQHVLLGRHVVWLTDSVQVVQVAERHQTRVVTPLGDVSLFLNSNKTSQTARTIEERSQMQGTRWLWTLVWGSGGLPLDTKNDTKYGLLFSCCLINTGSSWVERKQTNSTGFSCLLEGMKHTRSHGRLTVFKTKKMSFTQGNCDITTTATEILQLSFSL